MSSNRCVGYGEGYYTNLHQPTSNYITYTREVFILHHDKISGMAWVLELDGYLLLPAPRPRVSRRGVYYPRAYREQLEYLRFCMRGWVLPCVPIRLEIEVHKPIPITHRMFGDADNLAKAVMDALPIDDRYVVSLVVVKRQSDCARLVVRLYPDSSEGTPCG